jgi:hypothetical protein
LITSTVGTSFTRIETQDGIISADSYEFIPIPGDPDITVTATDDVITINTVQDLNQILQVLDFGPFSGQYTSIVQMNTAASNIDFGTFTNPGLINFDLGTFSGISV